MVKISLFFRITSFWWCNFARLKVEIMLHSCFSNHDSIRYKITFLDVCKNSETDLCFNHVLALTRSIISLVKVNLGTEKMIDWNYLGTYTYQVAFRRVDNVHSVHDIYRRYPFVVQKYLLTLVRSGFLERLKLMLSFLMIFYSFFFLHPFSCGIINYFFEHQHSKPRPKVFENRI